jgi:predicted nucleic acid-binding protein
MIILDTNVISALMRPDANRKVVSWLDRQPRLSVWTTAITVLEAEYGLAIMPASRRREVLTAAMRLLTGEIFDGRVLAFDHSAAQAAASLAADHARRGQIVDAHDTHLAGIALA